MKLDKLDFAVLLIVAICLGGLVVAAYLGDPSRQPARVAYLYPALAAQQDVWIAPVDDPSAQQQATFSEYGVYDFDFSPDGRWLAYADRSGTGTVTLRLRDLSTGGLRDLVDCVALAAYCSSPVFSPDGKTLAYQRAESFGASYGLTRIWLIDMTSTEYDTVPLIADKQVVGHSALWSADSNTVGFYSADRSQPGILIYEFVPRDGSDVQLRFIPSSHGTMGTLSPNGQQVVFPDLVRRNDQFFSHLQIADLANKEFAAFTDPAGPWDDVTAQWSPDGETIAFARRYTDDRWTPGHQLYLRRQSAAAEPTPIAFDERYSTSYARWNSAGDSLVLQRLPLKNADDTGANMARPEVWVHDLESGESHKIIEDAYLPQWVAG